MSAKRYGQTGSAAFFSLLLTLALCLVFAPSARAAGTITGIFHFTGSGSYTFTMPGKYDNRIERCEFTLPSDGTVQFTFTHAPGQSGNFWFDVFTAAGEEISSDSFDASDGVNSSVLTGLARGDYYVEIDGNYTNEFEVRFDLDFTPTPDWETENNDDVTTADVISVGETINGAFFEPFDRDWYTFTLSKATDVQLSFTHPLYTSGDTWLYLFGSHSVKDSEALWDDYHDMRDSGVTSGVMSLDAGTYYVKVTPNYNTTGQHYSLSITEVARTQTMYRLYNPNTGEHFYTASAAERDVLSQVGWRYEGIGWVAPASGSPIYRLYNPSAPGGDHHYTGSEEERDALIWAGWRYEGIGWYSGGSVPVYRQYNPNAASGTHNYTTSLAENDMLTRAGWIAEGVGWYAISAQ